MSDTNVNFDCDPWGTYPQADDSEDQEEEQEEETETMLT